MHTTDMPTTLAKQQHLTPWEGEQALQTGYCFRLSVSFIQASIHFLKRMLRRVMNRLLLSSLNKTMHQDLLLSALE